MILSEFSNGSFITSITSFRQQIFSHKNYGQRKLFVLAAKAGKKQCNFEFEIIFYILFEFSNPKNKRKANGNRYFG